MSWVNNLDALASAGVLEYDAAADIKGVAPRYFGNPPLETISDQLPEMKKQPHKDEFDKSDTIHHNPAWKKWLFAGVGIVALIFGIKNFKNIKGAVKNINFDWLKNIPKQAWNGIKNGSKKVWNTIKGVSQKPLTGIKNLSQKAWDGVKNVSQKAWSAIKNLWGNFTNLFKNTTPPPNTP